MFKTLIFALLIFPAFAPAAAQEKYVRFIDEAGKDKSLSDFRQKLLDAVKKRDANFVLSILDPQISNSFGGSGGIEEFKERWQINNRQSEFWKEMNIVLTNGGSFLDKKKQVFAAPYTFTQSFPKNADIYDHAVIFGENVKLRSKTESTAAVIATLSYNVVKPDYDNSIKIASKEFEFLWVKVETLGGKKGYVAGQYVRSPIDYRAVFEKKNGKWIMTAFIAGD